MSDQLQVKLAESARQKAAIDKGECPTCGKKLSISEVADKKRGILVLHYQCMCGYWATV